MDNIRFKQAKISINTAQILLLILTGLNVVIRCGKERNTILYKINDKIDDFSHVRLDL